MPVGEFGNVESDVEVPASEGWARLRGMLEDDVAMPRFDERVPSARHWDMPMQCVFLEAGLVRHGPTHGRLARRHRRGLRRGLPGIHRLPRAHRRRARPRHRRGNRLAPVPRPPHQRPPDPRHGNRPPQPVQPRHARHHLPQDLAVLDQQLAATPDTDRHTATGRIHLDFATGHGLPTVGLLLPEAWTLPFNTITEPYLQRLSVADTPAP